MRIAIFSDNFYPELSGISDSITTTARELGQRGHKIKFFVPKYRARHFRIANFPVEELDLGENVLIHRLRSLHFPGPNKQSRAVMPAGFNTMRVKKFKPDIIHTHLFFGAGWRALTAAKVLRVPLVGTSHTPIGEFIRYSPIKADWFKRWSEWYVSWYYNRCKFVSAPSGAIIREMRAFGFHRPSQVISNPIDLSAFAPVSEATKQKMKKHFGFSGRTILYTGRLAPEKNIDVVMRAVALAKKKFPDINFAITGHGSSRESLEALAFELGMGKEVKFLGTLHKQEFVKVYQAADIFAIASTAETQCISMMQAVAAGIPVIGVDWLGLGEYIQKMNGILIKMGDYRTMAQKIEMLFKDSKKYKTFGAAGLEAVKQFSIPKIADQWESVYAKVARRHPSA
jgi:1,2-diacylglycerol 3-alpha-glucosyltransferase